MPPPLDSPPPPPDDSPPPLEPDPLLATAALFSPPRVPDDPAVDNPPPNPAAWVTAVAGADDAEATVPIRPMPTLLPTPE